MNQFALLGKRRFAPFFWTQALGAFNDSAFRNAMVMLAAFQMGLPDNEVSLYTNLAPALFILPYFLFSATAGQLAEKFEKTRIIRYVKLFEIAAMLLAAWGFHTHNLILLLGVLFMMGVHSTVFGPIKYAILPQALKPPELVGGNGMVEMGTQLAILIGMVLGNSLMLIAGVGPWLAAGATVDDRRGRLRVQPPHSAGAGHCARAQIQLESVHRDHPGAGYHAQGSCGLQRGAGHFLVLVLRYGAGGAVADLYQAQSWWRRLGQYAGADAVLVGYRDWLAVVREDVRRTRRDWPGAAGRVRPDGFRGRPVPGPTGCVAANRPGLVGVPARGGQLAHRAGPDRDRGLCRFLRGARCSLLCSRARPRPAVARDCRQQHHQCAADRDRVAVRPGAGCAWAWVRHTSSWSMRCSTWWWRSTSSRWCPNS